MIIPPPVFSQLLPRIWWNMERSVPQTTHTGRDNCPPIPFKKNICRLTLCVYTLHFNQRLDFIYESPSVQNYLLLKKKRCQRIIYYVSQYSWFQLSIIGSPSYRNSFHGQIWRHFDDISACSSAVRMNETNLAEKDYFQNIPQTMVELKWGSKHKSFLSGPSPIIVGQSCH